MLPVVVGLTTVSWARLATLVNGVLTLEDTLLSDLSYAMEFHGGVDYVKEVTDLRVFVRLLESISNLANKIPGMKSITKRTTGKIGVHVTFSGSPYDMKTSTNVTGVKVITNTITRPFRRNKSGNEETPEDDSPEDDLQEETTQEEPQSF